ncbi:MAG: pyridoxamine 5'-phosphate oxidase family protein [Thermoleophilaceae bacterium]|nr:pyridoxamine 5'-phosphate oxidase family protein [Thermoleophilaceae bacterium]
MTKLRREPQLADPSWASIRQILRDTYLCHIAFADASGQAFSIPTIHALLGDELYVHGSAASRTLKALGGGAKICITVAETDGLVLARSVFNHSINYRSVMVFGRATLIEDRADKEQALHDFFEEVFPGRWAESREPTENEYKRAAILKLPLTEASAKISAGPPEDEDEDYALDIWAGVIPVHHTLGETQPDPELDAGIQEPASVARIRERWS